jgi:chemotaxis protein CheC
MHLNDVQHDALVELLNIGFGRAGASLSRLTGHRVLLEVPQVSIHPITSCTAFSASRRGRSRQRASDLLRPVAGDAMLMLDPWRPRR